MGIGEARAEGDEAPDVSELSIRRNGGQAVLQGVVGDLSAPLECGRGDKPERVHSRTRESVKCAFKVSDRGDLSANKVQSEFGPRALDDRLVPRERLLKAGGAEDADARYRRRQTLEKLELLARLLGCGLEGHAGHITPGPSQARHEPRTHGI